MKNSRPIKRPRDPNQLAKFIVDVATDGLERDKLLSDKKVKAGKRGAVARKKALSPKQRSEIASIAAQARWKKSD